MIADAKSRIRTVVRAVRPLVPDSPFGVTQSANVFTHLYNRTHSVFATKLLCQLGDHLLSLLHEIK